MPIHCVAFAGTQQLKIFKKDVSCLLDPWLWWMVLWIKLCQPVCPFVCPLVTPLSEDWLITFFCFLHKVSRNTKNWRNPFLRKILVMCKINRAFLGLKSTLLKFSLNMLIRFFWHCAWWQTLKSGSECLF